MFQKWEKYKKKGGGRHEHAIHKEEDRNIGGKAK